MIAFKSPSTFSSTLTTNSHNLLKIKGLSGEVQSEHNISLDQISLTIVLCPKLCRHKLSDPNSGASFSDQTQSEVKQKKSLTTFKLNKVALIDI